MVSFKNRLNIQNFICFSYKKKQMFAVQNFVYIYLFHLPKKNKCFQFKTLSNIYLFHLQKKKNVFSSKLCLIFICFTYKKNPNVYSSKLCLYLFVLLAKKTTNVWIMFKPPSLTIGGNEFYLCLFVPYLVSAQQVPLKQIIWNLCTRSGTIKWRPSSISDLTPFSLLSYAPVYFIWKQ